LLFTTVELLTPAITKWGELIYAIIMQSMTSRRKLFSTYRVDSLKAKLLISTKLYLIKSNHAILTESCSLIIVRL